MRLTLSLGAQSATGYAVCAVCGDAQAAALPATALSLLKRLGFRGTFGTDVPGWFVCDRCWPHLTLPPMVPDNDPTDGT